MNRADWEDNAAILEKIDGLHQSLRSLTGLIKDYGKTTTAIVSSTGDANGKYKFASQLMRYKTYLMFNINRRADQIFWCAEMDIVLEVVALTLGTNNEAQVENFMELSNDSKTKYGKELKRGPSRAHGNLREHLCREWLEHIPENLKNAFKSSLPKTKGRGKSKVLLQEASKVAAALLSNEKFLNETAFDKAWKEAIKKCLEKAHKFGVEAKQQMITLNKTKSETLPAYYPAPQFVEPEVISVPLGVEAFVITKVKSSLQTFTTKTSNVNGSHRRPWAERMIHLHTRVSERGAPYEFVEGILIPSALDERGLKHVRNILAETVKTEDVAA